MKEFFPEEPMELVGMAVPGGEDMRMAECIVEEFLLLGWSEQQLMLLFTRPFFRATYRFYLDHGEDCVRALIQRVMAAFDRGQRLGGADDA